MTRADVTAVTMFQATLPVPGRLIPKDPTIRAAIINGAKQFREIGCTNCHVPSLPLYSKNFCEPNPFNPAGNRRPSDGVPPLCVDLTDQNVLPRPRLKQRAGVIQVPAFTDLKLHGHHQWPRRPEPRKVALSTWLKANSSMRSPLQGCNHKFTRMMVCIPWSRHDNTQG